MISLGHMIAVMEPHGESVVSFQPGATLRDILISGGYGMHSACGGNGACGRCQVRVAESSSLPYTDAERLRLSATQLDNGIRLACQISPFDCLHVSLEKAVTQMSWRPLRTDEYSSLKLPVLPQTNAAHYGVAIDLGTTHIRLTLWDMVKGSRIAGRTGLNPQGSYGTDVLTRLMEASHSPEVAMKIGDLAQRAIGEALADIAVQAALDLHEVCKVFVVGNTAMLSLLGGKNFDRLLQPENWTRLIECQPDDTTCLCETWGVAKDAAIRFIAPLGGFIGSDLLSGVLATQLIEQPPGSLYIDFGTNSEMALWDGKTLHVTSTAGGPAFEGSGISCGMPGEAGAIYRVRQNGRDGFDIGVLGDTDPAGLCGSGLVDAVAWLLRNGKLDKVGRFANGSSGFVLYGGNRRIELVPADIDVLQRAKAAIGGGVLWLCRQAGLPLGELQQVYACGAFGQFLDVENARQIGLLPGVKITAIKLENNTALAGCEALLLSAASEASLNALSEVCKVYNLAEDAGFESLFVENLYLQPMQAPDSVSRTNPAKEEHHAE